MTRHMASPHARPSDVDVMCVQGTPEYFAPELARLALREHKGLLPKGYGSAVDNWAVGCIVFEMLVRPQREGTCGCARAFMRSAGPLSSHLVHPTPLIPLHPRVACA
jgi:serine/threonine protein kinase